MGESEMEDKRHKLIIEGILRLEMLTGEDFHGYMPEVYGVLAKVYDAGAETAMASGEVSLAALSDIAWMYAPQLTGEGAKARLARASRLATAILDGIAEKSFGYPPRITQETTPSIQDGFG